MAVTKRPILSSADPGDTHPWCDSITFDPATRQIVISGFNGLRDTAKHAAVNGTRIVALRVGKLTEKHALIVTTDGVLQFLPFSELPQICYAHLAFYDPTTQDVEVLEFKPRPRADQ